MDIKNIKSGKIIEIEGQFDEKAEEIFHQSVLRIDEGNIAIDMRNIESLNRVGLRCLLIAAKKIYFRKKVKLVLLNPSSRTKEVLSVTGSESYFAMANRKSA